ncbi:hypothetical protein OGAPHI_000499 [Ogataea philodendri]|uniref:Transcription factor tau 91 kDa subunit n=1 Tax=Ogataea philodendri TaxID=1378263 RepID=A0A9P8PG18_9ASCO|nr:uncharacterized protein OGAPHI_000499 [Ogataea philodendri]KAH3671276.1 hypothetical protein OGAPHI_000499 [Ogataea philodendri]
MSEETTPEPQATSTANATPVKSSQSRKAAKQTAEKLLLSFAEKKTESEYEEEPGNDRVILDEVPVKKETRGRKPKNWVPPEGYTPKKSKPTPKKRSVINDEFYHRLEDEYFQEITPLVSNPWRQKAGVKSSHQGETKIFHFHALNESYARKFQLGRDLMAPNVFHTNDRLLSSYQFAPLDWFPDSITRPIEHPISADEAHSRVSLTQPVSFAFDNNEPKPLRAGGVAQYPTNNLYRQGFVVNTGGLPLVSSFLNKPINGKYYLFVSVIASSETNNSVRKELSLGQPEIYDAAIEVFEIDLGGNVTSLKKTLVIPFGAVISFRWLLCSNPEESLLTCVCKDGILRILRVNAQFLDSPDVAMLTAPSVTINIPDFEILSCDWTSSSSLVLGLTDGHIAEVDIKDPEHPFYVVGLDIANIASITSTYSDALYEATSRIILVSATNCYNYLIDLDNLRVIAESQKSRIPCFQIQYSALLDGFVVADSTKTPKFVSKKDVQSNIGLHLWDENQVFSIAVSDYTPFLVSGYVNGTVRLYNVIRKVHSSAKLKVSPASAKLFKMDINKDEFRLDLSYQVSSDSKDVESHSIYDNRINVTSCALANTPACSGLLAASYANGLVVIERIMSAESI